MNDLARPGDSGQRAAPADVELEVRGPDGHALVLHGCTMISMTADAGTGKRRIVLFAPVLEFVDREPDRERRHYIGETGDNHKLRGPW